MWQLDNLIYCYLNFFLLSFLPLKITVFMAICRLKFESLPKFFFSKFNGFFEFLPPDGRFFMKISNQILCLNRKSQYHLILANCSQEIPHWNDRKCFDFWNCFSIPPQHALLSTNLPIRYAVYIANFLLLSNFLPATCYS